MSDDSKITPAEAKFILGGTLTLHCHSEGRTKWYDNLESPPISYAREIVLPEYPTALSVSYYCYGRASRRNFLAHKIVKVYGKKKNLNWIS